MKQTLLLIGLPGVGKTTIGKHLYQQVSNSQYVDGDDLWRVHPFEVTDDNKRMVEGNIRFLYQSFLDNPSLQYFIFSWVVANPDLLDKLTTWFQNTNPIVVLLECDKEAYVNRLHHDQRDLSILNRYDKMKDNYKTMNVHKIDTTNQSVFEIIKIIQEKYMDNL